MTSDKDFEYQGLLVSTGSLRVGRTVARGHKSGCLHECSVVSDLHSMHHTTRVTATCRQYDKLLSTNVDAARSQ